MGLEITNNLSLGGIERNFFSNTIQQKVVPAYVTTEPSADYISTKTDLAKYLNERAIREMIEVNSEVKQILKKLKINLNLNMKALDNLAQNHLPQTKKIAVGIVNHLPQSFKKAVELQSLQKAAVLHDIGKVLIPANIMNKAGALTDAEREIMQKHSDLSYELLKTTDLDETTLDLVKNHHQNAQKTGYPQAEEHFVYDINNQILSVADVYSALREKRSYKAAMGKNQALAIIHEDVKEGKLHPYVFKALVDWANETEENSEISQGSTKIKPQWKVLYNKLANCLSA